MNLVWGGWELWKQGDPSGIQFRLPRIPILHIPVYYSLDSVTPSGTYFRLKLSLILSVVSQQSLQNDEKASGGHIHILAVSKDVLPIQRLFLFAKSFAGRSVVFSPCNDLCFSISKDHCNTGSCIIHGT